MPGMRFRSRRGGEPSPGAHWAPMVPWLVRLFARELTLLFHVFNDSCDPIFAHHGDDMVTFFDLIGILSCLRDAKTDFFPPGVLYCVMPSLNVCQLSCDPLHFRVSGRRCAGTARFLFCAHGR